MKLSDLSKAGREELALALVLWKDFKTEGRLDVQITMQSIAFAEMLGVRSEFETILTLIPPMKITPRYQP